MELVHKQENFIDHDLAREILTYGEIQIASSYRPSENQIKDNVLEVYENLITYKDNFYVVWSCIRVINEKEGEVLIKSIDGKVVNYSISENEFEKLANKIDFENSFEHVMETILSYVPPKQVPYVNNQKIGRNDKCHCGSEKKFKNCCAN